MNFRLNSNLIHLEDTSEDNVGGHWCGVNHIAICVSDVGRSVSFYCNVVGMTQILRPDFDRFVGFNMKDLDLITFTFGF